MTEHSTHKYRISLGFEEISIPPFKDILIVARDSAHGKLGLSKTMELLNPDAFETFYPEDNELVEVIFVNKKILKKIDWDNVYTILHSNVFPYLSKGEILKVDFKVAVDFPEIEIDHY